jgi:very-short-patch-repair endonuclease
MRDRRATEEIRLLAERQHGIVTRRQLLRRGLTHRLVEGRVEAGVLVAVYDGVFAVGHRKLSREAIWLAAVFASGPGAVLSHGSAAELWKIGVGGDRVEVTRRSGGTTRAVIWVHQTRFLPSDHVAVEKGIPVTSVERTILDMAARRGRRGLERMVVDADRARLVDWRQLRRVVERGVGRKGVGRLRRVVRDIDPHSRDTRSPLEVDLLALCRKAGLPKPEVNVLVEGHLVDFLWPAERLVVETDGYAFHSDRAAFERDRERDLDLTAAGYEVSRFTYRMLTRHPSGCAKRIREALGRRGASNSPPGAGDI